MIAVIMAGGIGSRFWPKSRETMPKQFLNIIGEKSMIKQTVERIKQMIDLSDIYVVTNEEQAKLVEQHLPELDVENIIIEPMGRNTAACIGLSAIFLKRKYQEDEPILVLPADHLIRKEDIFRKLIINAGRFVKETKSLATFGIIPTYPATGYGYIQIGEMVKKDEFSIYRVKSFKEKPNNKTAKKFYEAKIYLWNSGIFIWTINTILAKISQYMPDLQEGLHKIEKLWAEQGYKASISHIYEKLESVPVDIGIMEKADNVVVFPVDIGWDDVGSWQAAYKLSEKDENGNYLKGNILTIDAKNNYISGDKRLIAVIGVKNLVIVDTEDALLICKKDKAQDVKKVVEKLREKPDSSSPNPS